MTLASTLKRILLAAVAIGILFTYLNHNEIDYLKREYFHKHFHKKNAGGLVAIQYIHKGASRTLFGFDAPGLILRDCTRHAYTSTGMVAYSKRWHTNGSEQYSVVYNDKLGIDLVDVMLTEGVEAVESKIASLGDGGLCSQT